METCGRKPVAELFGVPDRPRNGRERLIDKAIELFYRHGLNAVGVDRILHEAGVTKTTFYKHFDSKDELMVAAIRKRDEWEIQAWRRAVRELAGDDPRDQLLGVFDVLDHWFNAPDFGGCMFLNAASEFPNPHDPVHEAAAAHKKRMRDDARDLAAAAGLNDPERFADLYAMILEGALVLRQVHGRNDAARLARQSIEALIGRFAPAKPARRGRAARGRARGRLSA